MLKLLWPRDERADRVTVRRILHARSCKIDDLDSSLSLVIVYLLWQFFFSLLAKNITNETEIVSNFTY